MAQQTAVQREARQVEDGRLKRMEAVVERQQDMAAKGDNHGFVFA